MIPFNIPCSTNDETKFILQAQSLGQIAGNGHFTKLCQSVVKKHLGFENTLFTPSCTSALEIAASLCNFKKGDEVILPSFTHVGTANAFVRSGAKIKFCDCDYGKPHISPEAVKTMIGPNTKAIILVHYAGIACDMDAFFQIAQSHNIILIEDAAHAIGAKYNEEWLGSLGDFAAFSFHETKNITSGHGGMLIIKRKELMEEALEIWNQGTNRSLFEQGATQYYTWSRPGGAFQMPELNAAFLYAQLIRLDEINERRKQRWKQYYDFLLPLQHLRLFSIPDIPAYAQHNAHIFFLIMKTRELRDNLLEYLNNQKIHAVFHYVPLHSSKYAMSYLDNIRLPNTEQLAANLLRLPLYDSLKQEEVENICNIIQEWTNQNYAGL